MEHQLIDEENEADEVDEDVSAEIESMARERFFFLQNTFPQHIHEIHVLVKRTLDEVLKKEKSVTLDPSSVPG